MPVGFRLIGASVSQIAASWAVAPGIAACFGALIFLSIKFLVLTRRDPLKWGLRLIPFYAGLTGGILALFISKHSPQILHERHVLTICSHIWRSWDSID